MQANLFIASMALGLGFSSAAQRVEISWWRRYVFNFHYPPENFAGFSFAFSTVLWLLAGAFSLSTPELVFCSAALTAEALNRRWRDARSRTFAVYVGIVTPLLTYWETSTVVALVVSGIIGFIVSEVMRRWPQI